MREGQPIASIQGFAFNRFPGEPVSSSKDQLLYLLLVLACVSSQSEDVAVGFSADVYVVVQHLDRRHPVCVVVPSNLLRQCIPERGRCCV